jgi:hypothetical protein
MVVVAPITAGMAARRSSVLAPLLLLVLIHRCSSTCGSSSGGGSVGAAAGGRLRSTTWRVSCADRADCTPELQAALYDGGTDHVVVPNDHGHLLWPSHQLRLNRSDVVLRRWNPACSSRACAAQSATVGLARAIRRRC